MKKGLIFAIIFQICVLFSILIKANLPLFLGDEIKLNAKGVDPRDMFLGNYVRLMYDFNRFKSEIKYLRGEAVYQVLKEQNGIFIKDKISKTKPKNGIFLKGIITYSYKANFKDKLYSNGVEFGIENYYTTAKNARILEKKLMQYDAIVSIKTFHNQSRIIGIKINE